MPELPEVETIRIALDKSLAGALISECVQSQAVMRWAIPRDLGQRISGRSIAQVWRRGKYILMDIAGKTKGSNTLSQIVLLHLGMSGSVRIYEDAIPPPAKKHDHLRVTCQAEAGVRHFVLNDPRRFGGVQCIAAKASDDDVYAPVFAHPLIRHLGIEPLAADFTAAYLLAGLKNRRAAIKTLLLDQRLVVGIGNIYAAEALFMAGIAPDCAGGDVTGTQAQKLVAAIKKVLRAAIQAGGTSLRDHVQPGGEIGYFAQQLNVYGRESQPCPRCQTAIQSLRQGGRASFFCPQCQK